MSVIAMRTFNQNGIQVELCETNGITIAVLLQEIIFSYKGQLYTIPVGFRSDGASLPRFFWRLIGHPFDMSYLREAIIHDYLYKYQVCTRKEADRFFFVLLEDNNLGFKRYLIYIGLRIGGRVSWNNHKKYLVDYDKFLGYSKVISNLCSLKGAEVCDSWDIETLKSLEDKIWNGYAPEIIKYFVKSLLPVFRITLYILYFKYSLGGKGVDFFRVNEEFQENSLKLIKARYYKFDPRRYLLTRKIKRIKKLYDLFGWVIFNKKSS